MLFHSPIFFVFFAAYFAAHLLVPPTYRLWLIIVGGAVFYSQWNPVLTWVPFTLAIIGWGGALWIAQSKSQNVRKAKLAATVCALAMPLLVFKYTNFALHQVIAPLADTSFGWSLRWPLPLGISFVTFTMMAYVIDYYRGKYPIECRPHMVAAYMVFFPHLIAGPILRPHEIIPQLDRPRAAFSPNFKYAFALFTVGLVKKVVFANQFADVVDHVYSSTGGLSALDYVLGIYAFSGQIYCDFSAYTDMAIALALSIGVRLPNNFNRPYAATSVAEFWRRWHITLSFWLRDYIYISLGGNRAGWVRRIWNVMVTMVVGGLWHGASWTFAIWGAMHGLFIIISQLTYRKMKRGGFLRALAIFVTFHIVSILWILFRAHDMATAWRVGSGPFVNPLGDLPGFMSANVYSLVLLAAFFVVHPFDTHGRVRFLTKRVNGAVFWPLAIMVWALVITLGADNPSKFIYFDF